MIENEISKIQVLRSEGWRVEIHDPVAIDFPKKYRVWREPRNGEHGKRYAIMDEQGELLGETK